MTSMAPANGSNHFDFNLWFSASGGSDILIDWRGKFYRRFGDYQRESGQDGNSRFADPLFVDPKNGNFSLKPESPALKLGFQPIDISRVGPRE